MNGGAAVIVVDGVHAIVIAGDRSSAASRGA
jgi:hypothetical protein